jgi:hypothetical protein
MIAAVAGPCQPPFKPCKVEDQPIIGNLDFCICLFSLPVPAMKKSGGSRRSMTLYLAQNGERLGPYTLAQVQDLVREGRARDTDLAWYEGQTTWVPLRDVPGFVSPRPTRPVGVWIISLLFFACTPFSLLGLVGVALMQRGVITVPPQEAAVFQQLGPLYYIIYLINTGLVLTWVVLFFMLRRASLWFFIASLSLGLLFMLYNLVTQGTVSPGSTHTALTVVILGVSWALNAALLYYNWHLIRKGVMR